MSETNAPQGGTAAKPPPGLLFVDDEGNILSSLKRLFRPHGYRIFTAESGRQGLEILGQEPIDLVISDMRMPEMNGAEFLEQVRARWPKIVRILLTGHAEIAATIDAINKGQIYRYISKPWEDNDMILTVRQALERQALEDEKVRLERLTQRQNEQLKALNVNLEKKVQERTAELQQAMEFLNLANQQLKTRTTELSQTMNFLNLANEELRKGFFNSIQVFSNLIEMRAGTLAGHSRRVAEMAQQIALRIGMPDSEVQTIMTAGLLHDIGKLGLPDELLRKPFGALTAEERLEVIKHPAKGQAALMGLDQLKDAAILIRGHHERFDGQGFPDGLAGFGIPMGARVLAVANDYDALRIGTLVSKPMSSEQAIQFIQESRGHRYDPQVVDAFLAVVGAVAKEVTGGSAGEITLPSSRLKPGLVLTRDVISRDNVMLLPKGRTLDENLILQIRSFEKSDGHPLTIHVKG